MPTKIFFLGPTGYIGGTVLMRLREHPEARNFEITALVRNPTKRSVLESFGIKTLFGDLDNSALLERQATESDMVFACAEYWHADSYKAILKGLKKRHQRTGTTPAVFQVSSAKEDDGDGTYSTDVIQDDMNLQQNRAFVNTNPSDPLLYEADKQGYVRTYTVIPPSIYGLATGPLVDLGIQRFRNTEMHKLIRAGITRKRAGMVAQGVNIWSHVHLSGVGDVFMALFDAVLDGRAGHGLEGMCYAVQGECTMQEICESIGEALVDLGVSHPGEETPTTFDAKDLARPENYKMAYSYGSNSRCRGNRSRMLGWKPRYTKEDRLEQMRLDVEYLVENTPSMR